MQCYTELTPPTAVTHSISLPFLSPKSNSLVVAKTSLLQIFELKTIITETVSTSNDDAVIISPVVDAEIADLPQVQRTEHTSKLVLVGEYPLSGTVTSLARVKALDTKSGAEALLIAFRDAKLSLVEWDAELHSLNTISIHYYEGSELSGAPWTPDLENSHNFLTVDPSSRCAALKFGARSLAILPFRQTGDDLVGDDYDPDLDDPLDDPPQRAKTTNGEPPRDKNHTPYTSSFVLPLTALDPTLTIPIHLAFLYEYREPTFGVLSSSITPAATLLQERKDVLSYTVFTLDLEQRASTTLLSISGIPYDISRVFPLSLPVGGALLIGGNEIIHVDQAGKTNAIAVNEFARACTSFPMADQSELALKLEGCIVEQISADTSDILIILSTGDLVILTFTLDGRSVSSMALQRVTEECGGTTIQCGASCATSLGRGRIFVGSEDGESVLLGWASKTAQLSRKRSRAELFDEDGDSSFDEEDLEDIDDDLYDDGNSPVKQSASSLSGSSAPGSYSFRVHDVLQSLAPMRDICFGSRVTSAQSNSKATNVGSTQTAPASDLVISTGRRRAGGVTILNREVEPKVLKQTDMTSARGIWSVHAKRPPPKDLMSQSGVNADGEELPEVNYDRYVFICKSGENGNDETVVYSVKGENLEDASNGDVEHEDASTMDVGTLANGTRIVQVLRDSIRTYDSGMWSNFLSRTEHLPNHTAVLSLFGALDIEITNLEVLILASLNLVLHFFIPGVATTWYRNARLQSRSTLQTV